VLCKKGKLEKVSAPTMLELGRHTFRAQVAALRCSACKETFFDGPMLARFEQAVAAALGEAGEVSGEVLAFQRKTLGLSGRELAELLDVTPEHLSRWENGKAALDRRAAVLVARMALERLEGRAGTLEHLRSLRKPRHLPRAVTLQVA
jgi:putative zinc finger/helix-turn-helix YgiT family protein